ncbi:anti-sigma regulatory factor [Candidatus Entotheonella palauensis]|uniref:anti-sigma regulatory factor n=1 Tax=Candidatus Entotheonella palauensis TaxID=93172 RepID=UPI002117403C|nr:anti-sigma regulatory factor [Candidatus Entotheonella palauensis]
MGQPMVVPVTAEHQVIQAWQTVRTLAESDGFGRVVTYYVVTSVAELANNLVLHASRGGTISMVLVRQGDRKGIEVVAEDDGPGIADISQALQDGFSTIGGMGSGLPGVVRLMDECEITSTLGSGTRVVARKWQPCR